MSKLNKIKELLQKALQTFGQVSSDKGILAWAGEGELPEVGDAIHGLDEEGNEIALEDGEYTLESGVVIVIKDGKVEEIREPEAPAEPEAEPEVEPEAMEGEDPIIEPEIPVEPEPAEVAIVPTLEERVNALEELVIALAARIEALENKPLAEPAAEEFKSLNKPSYKSTGNDRIDRLNKILNA